MAIDRETLREAEWAFNFLAKMAEKLSGPKASALLDRSRRGLARLQTPRGELIAVNEDGRRIGESHPRAKLSDQDVDRMFEMRRTGVPVARIAEQFKVSRRHAGRVLSCKARNHTASYWRRVRP